MRPRTCVSVAMCTYNGERYLAQQLDSIATQTLLPCELVICDDGSTDSTQQIVTAFTKQAPFRVISVRNSTNLGVAKNFEQAICLCKGDFIALCDQDDLWYPNKLACLSEVLESDVTIGGVFSDADLIDAKSRVTRKRLWATFRFTKGDQRRFIKKPTSVFYKRSVVTGATMMIRADLRNIFLPIQASWLHDSWIAWMLAVRSRLTFIPSRLIAYRVHSGQQAGVPNIALGARLCHTRQIESNISKLIAQQLEDLRSFLAASPNKTSNEMLEMEALQEAIDHARARAGFGGSFIIRSKYILSHLREYATYSSGVRTIIKDLFPF